MTPTLLAGLAGVAATDGAKLLLVLLLLTATGSPSTGWLVCGLSCTFSETRSAAAATFPVALLADWLSGVLLLLAFAPSRLPPLVQYHSICPAMTALSADALTNAHQSVRSPVSVAVVKTRASVPASELKTRNAESWPVLPVCQMVAICGSLLERDSGMDSASRLRSVSTDVALLLKSA